MIDKTETLAIGNLMAQSGVGFGTSGARGLADAMTDRVCYAYTVGFLQYLERGKLICPGDFVAIAGDFRPSSPRIMAACGKAALELGYRPVNCGFVPTPAVAAYGIAEGIASLMVTGSHIPDDRNGIKFNKPSGEVLKVDEAGIRDQVISLPAGLFAADGSFREAAKLPTEESAAYRRYLSRYLDFFPTGCLNGARVLLYEHSSVARSVLRDTLEGLGAEVLCKGRCDHFVPVDTEAIRPEDALLARDWAATESFDAIVSADGDGDRPLVGNESGEWLRGDVAGIFTARFLGADYAVTPVSSNTALERSGWIQHSRRTRIGSPFVIAEMMQAIADGGRCVVGFEANGGFLTGSDIVRDGRIMTALPTRDAVIVALALILGARQNGLTLSGLAATLPARFTLSDRLQAFPTELSRAKIDALQSGGATVIESVFADLGPVADIDSTDGLRIRFVNDEIVHLRPSGNAPELRCYNEAASLERARVLQARCMAVLETWRAESS